MIEKERITHLFLPPTAVYALLSHPRTKRTDFSSLKGFIVGAAPIAPEKFKEAVRVFGPVMYEGFGQTETLIPILIKRPEHYLKSDSGFDEETVRAAGKAVDVVRVGIMDPGGEICSAPAAAARSSCAPRWSCRATRRNGRRVHLRLASHQRRQHRRPSAFVTIVDRIKDMIVSGGFNIFPVEIEVIQGHPAVLDCIVVRRTGRSGAKPSRPWSSSARPEGRGRS